MDIVQIAQDGSAVAGALKTAFEMLKALKDFKGTPEQNANLQQLRSAIIEAQGAALQAQSDQVDLISQFRALSDRCDKLEDWERAKQRYALKNYGGNTFAGLRPDQVAFGVPSGRSSANSGFTTSADVSNALNCLTKLLNCGTIVPKQAYPGFRGVMTWSINWDKHDGYNFSAPTKAVLKTLP